MSNQESHPQFVYILASRKNGAIYIGLARDLRQRMGQHRSGGISSHTKKYDIFTFVYFEIHETLEAALLRERRLKRWKRDWKDELIESVNPGWADLSEQIPL